MLAVIDGPKKITYNVPALPEGRYFFRCDPHPEFMYGNFIVGNPPFLGGKRLRSELGDEYVDRLFGL